MAHSIVDLILLGLQIVAMHCQYHAVEFIAPVVYKIDVIISVRRRLRILHARIARRVGRSANDFR